MTTQFSPSNWAVHKTNDFFRVADQDGLVKTGAKATARAVTNTVLTVAATVETVVLAVLTALTLGQVKSLRNRTVVAASTIVAATKGIVGIEAKKAELAPASRRERIAAALRAAAAKIGNNPGKVATAAVATMAVVAGAIVLRNYFAAAPAMKADASVDEILNNVWNATGKVFSQSHKDALANVTNGSFNGIASAEAAKILA